MLQDTPVCPFRRKLDPDSPEAQIRDVLLMAMQDPSQDFRDRMDAAITSLPFCFIEPPPIYKDPQGNPIDPKWIPHIENIVQEDEPDMNLEDKDEWDWAAAREVAIKRMETVIPDAFKGDSHFFLQAIYRDPEYPMEIRMAAATGAAHYEHPKLYQVDLKITQERKAD